MDRDVEYSVHAHTANIHTFCMHCNIFNNPFRVLSDVHDFGVWSVRRRQRVNLNIHTTYALVMRFFFGFAFSIMLSTTFYVFVPSSKSSRSISIYVGRVMVCAAKIEAFHTENSVNTLKTTHTNLIAMYTAMRKVGYGIQYIPKSFESTYLLVRFCSDDFNTIESKPISDGYSGDSQRLCTYYTAIGM